MRHRVPAAVEDEPHEQIPLLVQPHARLVQHLDLERVLQSLKYLQITQTMELIPTSKITYSSYEDTT